MRQYNFSSLKNLFKGKTYNLQWTSNRYLNSIKVLVKNRNEIVKSYSPKIKSEMKEKYLLWQWQWRVPEDIPLSDDYKIVVEAIACHPNSSKKTKMSIETKKMIKISDI
jgi:hypothetical protein